MNRPCFVHFHPDDAPLVTDLPERYQARVVSTNGYENSDEKLALTIAIDHAFYIDFAPHLLRTRAGGNKEEDPVDFPVSSISFIEWFYDKKG
jgi:hypothetical protein